mmetsp:Transcript_80909/g.187903  ORF Transcript_80909/g.187903 Transcript_80909/m.187903 type:complete len:247 (+) Transcript_80909:721-1461(+)
MSTAAEGRDKATSSSSSSSPTKKAEPSLAFRCLSRSSNAFRSASSFFRSSSLFFCCSRSARSSIARSSGPSSFCTAGTCGTSSPSASGSGTELMPWVLSRPSRLGDKWLLTVCSLKERLRERERRERERLMWPSDSGDRCLLGRDQLLGREPCGGGSGGGSSAGSSTRGGSSSASSSSSPSAPGAEAWNNSASLHFATSVVRCFSEKASRDSATLRSIFRPVCSGSPRTNFGCVTTLKTSCTLARP